MNPCQKSEAKKPGFMLVSSSSLFRKCSLNKNETTHFTSLSFTNRLVYHRKNLFNEDLDSMPPLSLFLGVLAKRPLGQSCKTFEIVLPAFSTPSKLAGRKIYWKDMPWPYCTAEVADPASERFSSRVHWLLGEVKP